MKKRTLIVTQNFYPVIGSAGNRMKNIFQLLNKNEIETHVITTEPGYPNKNMYKDSTFWDDEQLNEESDKIYRVQIKNSNSLNLYRRLFFYIEIMFRFLYMMWRIRKEKYDYIIVSTPPIFIVLSAMIGKIFLRSKLILEVRDLWPDSLIGVKAFNSKIIIKIFRLFEMVMYRRADHIVINSNGVKSHIQAKLKRNKDKIIYLPNGPRMYELVQDKTNQTDFNVVYTGNIGLAQDVEKLKQIAFLLHKNNIGFHVMGYGMKRQDFIEYIKKNNLSNVIIHDASTRKQSLELIKSCSIAIA